MSGCDDSPPPGRDAGPDGGPVDARFYPDGTVSCQPTDSCDDGVACTRDACIDGICVNASDPASCSDGIFCNGVERCLQGVGCAPGERVTCNDDDVCTIDRCDEEADTCGHFPRDLDEDGDPDFFCSGGDCDDTNPVVNSTFPEVCADRFDNDCDTTVDESACGRPLYDQCTEPLVIRSSGVFSVSTRGARADYTLGCAGRRPDIAAQIEITTRSSLVIDAVSEQRVDLGLALRSDCAGTDIACRAGQSRAGIGLRSIEPGTYYLIASSAQGSAMQLGVQIAAPIDPPPNDTCASPTDVSAGGRFTSTLVEVRDDLAVSCAGSGSADLVYTFTTTAVRDVQITARTDTNQFVGYSLRTTCEDGASQLRCDYARPARGTIHQLPAGTYFLVVDTPATGTGQLLLDVAFAEPTAPLPGDQCGAAIELTAGPAVDATLTGMENDVDVSCGLHYADVVYTFELTAPSDVAITKTGTPRIESSLRTACSDGASQIRCFTASGTHRERIRNLAPGRYYLVMESPAPGAFTVQLEVSAATLPVDVSGNETCDSSYLLPASGGLFRGNTSAMANDLTTLMCGSNARSPDAVYRFEFDRNQRVRLQVDGDFNPVLHVHRAACTSGGETFCDDNSGGGTSPLMDRELSAGTWFVVVDGWGAASSGEYLLEANVRDP